MSTLSTLSSRRSKRAWVRRGAISTVLAVTCLQAGLTMAEEPVQEVPETVVSASRVPLPVAAVGSAVTVITAEDLERRQVRLVSDALRDVPGVAVNRSGGPGTVTQVRIRGAEANQTLVVIDGVEVNNPAGGSEFDFANLLASDIERIEVLRGPQSALYGSDAIGGVINIVTKGGPGRGVEMTGSAEYGSYNTSQVSASGRAGLDDKIRLSLNVTRYNSTGISAAEEKNGNDENDGFKNRSINAKLKLTPFDFLEFDLTGRNVDSTTEFDSFVGGLGAVDANRQTESEQTYGRAGTKLTLFDGLWEHIGSVAYSREFDETFSNEAESSESDGRKKKFAYQTNLFFDTPEIAGAAHTATFAVERENESVESNSAFVNVDRDLKATSYIGEYRLDLFDRIFLSGALRHDDNDTLFDDTTTFRTTAAYLHEETGSRLHGSYGTGVKNPTVFELFGFAANFNGNPNLKPEESRGWDIGLEQSFFDGEVIADVTYFQNRIDDLILGAGNTAINLDGTTKIEGVEVTAQAEILPSLDLIGSYTFTKTRGADGNDLVRRAKHIASANLDYGFDLFGRPGNVSLGVDFNGDQKDFAFDAAFNRSIVTLNRFTLVNAALDYEVYPGVTLFARGENLLDEDYQEVLGFGTPGLALYGGLSVKFGPFATDQ